jgi:hypothetical protein
MRASENPFRIERIHALAYRPQGTSWPELTARFDELGRRAAIVGPHGSGKSTLLAELSARLERTGLSVSSRRLNDDSSRPGVRDLREWLRAADSATVIALDGAEFLGWRAGRWLTRATRECAGLLMTTHGKPRLPVLLRTHTSVELLAELTRELLGTEEALAESLLEELYACHAGDIRRCLFELYDRAARGEPDSFR